MTQEFRFYSRRELITCPERSLAKMVELAVIVEPYNKYVTYIISLANTSNIGFK